MKRKGIILFILILLGGVILYACASNIAGLRIFKKEKRLVFMQPEKTGREDSLLPSFTILLPDSSTYINIGSIPPGKPTVLFYFLPYCPFCQAEMVDILKNMDQLRDIQFYLFTPYPFNDMKVFYEKFDLKKYHNVKIGTDFNYFFGPYFNAGSVPFIAVYGKDRKLNGAFVGSISSEQVVAYANE